MAVHPRDRPWQVLLYSTADECVFDVLDESITDHDKCNNYLHLLIICLIFFYFSWTCSMFFSIVYSEEANELFGGGIGCVLHWKVAAVSKK